MRDCSFYINQYGALRLNDRFDVVGKITIDEIRRELSNRSSIDEPFILSPEIIAHQKIGNGHKIAFGVAESTVYMRYNKDPYNPRDVETVKVNLPPLVAIFSITPGVKNGEWINQRSSITALRSTHIQKETQCYRLMIPNLQHMDGAICWNSVSMKNSETDPLKFCQRYVNLFFSSTFNNHLNPDEGYDPLEKLKERQAAGGRLMFVGNSLGTFSSLWINL